MSRKRVKLITWENTHNRVNGWLRTLLRATVAGHNFRFALKNILVEPNRIIATDGRKLAVVEIAHTIKPGLYYITQDGYVLFDDKVMHFPKYRDIMLKPKKSRSSTIQTYGDYDKTFSVLVYRLNRADIVFDLSLLQESLKSLLKTDPGEFTMLVAKEKPRECPFQLEVAVGDVKISYLQMPVNI